MYSARAGSNYDDAYEEKALSGNLKNPLTGLSIVDAQNEFDERSVYYLLYLLKVYNLHTPPGNSELPEIDVIIDGTFYHATVVSGSIYITMEKSEKKDIVIRATLEEAITMVQNPETISESFRSGKASIEYVSDGSTLLYKGYYTMTSDLTGKSFTGNVIQGYFS